MCRVIEFHEVVPQKHRNLICLQVAVPARFWCLSTRCCFNREIV
jgi:hypothetical protein